MVTVLQRNAVSAVNADCPSTSVKCDVPPAEKQDVQNNESNANLYQGLSIGLLIAGTVAVGGGIVLLATAPSKSSTVSLAAGAPGTLAGLSIQASF